MTNPFEILSAAIKRVPSLKYALAVTGVISVIAIVVSLRLDLRVAAIGFITVVVFMALILIFSKLAMLDKESFRHPAMFLLWFSVILPATVASLLVSSVFKGWPLNLQGLLLTNEPKANSRILDDLLRSASPSEADKVLDRVQSELSLADHLRYEQIASELGEALGTFKKQPDLDGPYAQYRNVRNRMMSLLKRTATKNLSEYLRPDAFTDANLESFDLHNSELMNMNFDNARLVWTNLSGAYLDGSTFRDAFLQGAEFRGADLNQAVLTGADWYNAFSFDVASLSQQQRSTLEECPKDIPHFIASFNSDYVTRFETMPSPYQEKFQSRWKAILAPGKDCHLVAEAHKRPGR